MANIKVMNKVTKKELEQQYLAELKTTREIAIKYDCDKTTILNLLRKYNIPVRNKGGGGKKQVQFIEFNGIQIESKECTGCKVVKPLTEFDMGAKGSGGRQPKCRICRRIYYSDNKIEILKKTRAYYYNNKSQISLKRRMNYNTIKDRLLSVRREEYNLNREERQQKARRYYANRKSIVTAKERLKRKINPEKYRAKEREYYPKRIEQRKIYHKTYYQKNQLTIKLNAKRRKTKVRELPFQLNVQNWLEIQEHFGQECALSTHRKDLTMEHFIPVSWGHGGTYRGNVYPVHCRINRSKSATNPFIWAERSDVKKLIDMQKWNRLVKILAQENNLEVDEFRRFVDWCESNKRTVEQIKNDPRTSLEIWKKAHRHTD